MCVLKGDELLFLLLLCSGYIGAKLGVPVAGTFTLLLYRFLVMMLVVAVIISVRREWRALYRDTLLVGFFAHFVWLVAIFKAFEFGLNAGSVALIAAFQPALTALVSPLLLGKANDALRWCGIGVGFAGVLVFVAGDMNLSATALWVYGLPLLATFCLTFVTVWGRRAAKIDQRDFPVMTALFWHGLLAALCPAPLAWWFEGFAAAWGGQLVFAIIWLAIPVSIGAYGLMFYLIRTRDATRISALQYFVPPVTMMIAWAVFGEALAGLGFLGLFVTSVGFYLMSLSQRRANQRQSVCQADSASPAKC